MSQAISHPSAHERGSFLSENYSQQPHELFTDYIPSVIEDFEPVSSYAVREEGAFSPFSSRGKAIGKTALYNIISDGRRYNVYTTSVDQPEIDFAASGLQQPADDVQTHGWMTERAPGNLYDKRAEREAKLGNRVISISHVQSRLDQDTRFFDLGNDMNAIANAIATAEFSDRPYDLDQLRSVMFSGYSQGGAKAVVAAAQAAQHDIQVDGLRLNRPAMFDKRSFKHAAKQTLPLPIHEVIPTIALAFEDPRNFIEGIKVFRTSSNELINHALVVPKLIGGIAYAMSLLDSETKMIITEASNDVFNQDWSYSKYARKNFPNATVREIRGVFSGHLGCGSKSDEDAELAWQRAHNATRKLVTHPTTPTPPHAELHSVA